jgi:hypothetical protein
MSTSVQVIQGQLVDFPADGVGHDRTEVWLLAYAGQVLKDDCAYVPLETTTQLLFPVDRFVGLDLTWEQHQERYTELLQRVETDPTLRTNYLSAYELAAIDTGRPYMSISTIEHPQLTRPLMMVPHLYGAFLIGFTYAPCSNWYCTKRNLTESGHAFYEQVQRILPSTVLGLLTLRGTGPLVPLVLEESDTDDA